MTVDPTPPAQRSGLAILTDIVVAPASAFQALREQPRWVWAFIIVCVLGIAGALLQIPAGVHMVAASLTERAAHDPNFATMSPERQRQIVAQAQGVQRYAWVFFPVIALVAIALTSGIMLALSAIAKGHGRFAQLFALAANVAVINFGIGYLLIGVLIALRGPESFSTQRDMLTVLPSLAWLVPNASPKIGTFLSTFNPFQIWSCFLFAAGLRSIAGIARFAAFAIAAIVSFGAVLFVAPFAQ